MDIVSRAQRLKAEDLIKGIRDISYQINLESNTPLIIDLRINLTFKNKAKKEGTSVINLILSAL